MKKLFALSLLAMLSVTAFAQLPKHEFTIDAFGGVSQLNYKLNPDFAGSNVTYPIKPGGGAGIGYTWFFAPKFGLRTGAEFALYRGEFSASKNPWEFYKMENGDLYGLFWTNISNLNGSSEISKDLITLKETQTLYSIQIPLMLEFITPVNALGTNHFYAALGARFLFNVTGSYKRSVDGWLTEFPDGNPDGKFGMEMVGDEEALTFQRPIFGSNMSADDYASRRVYMGQLAYQTERRDYSDEGKFMPGRFNVLASGELGFRWRLAPKLALYTGLYFDYGILSMIQSARKDLLVRLDADTEEWSFSQGSMLEKQFENIKITATEGDSKQLTPKINNYGVSPICSRLTNLGGGLKLRLAFGVGSKVHEHSVVPAEKKKKEKKPVEESKPEPVVEEVPEEIQKTMADLSNTMFDFDKYVIKEEAKAKLDDVVKWLLENPDVKVEVAGHTDNWGSDEYNQKLSENRAKAVYEYFVSKGVEKSRLRYVGYGELRPIATNATDEGRAQNRRVELTIIE